ncbi:OmpA family protein [Flammeovirga sp. SubArs3]|uniref:OmpA family protein n=1 Tax=Flammeovirga sp. SubArs3 TaxID=2995316 RepID=UPI00248C0EC0|nr:OmpA family protein [Flammeovirga sp. SubArs3]
MILALTTPYLYAQTIYWADHVIGYSSQYDHFQNSAEQALGSPNVSYNQQSSPLAWMSNEDSLATITIGFAVPIEGVNQILISEAFYHNTIAQVSIFDGNGNEKVIYTQKPSYIKSGGELSSFFINKKWGPVQQIKVIQHGLTSTRMSGIDAIGMSTSSSTISIQPKVSNHLSPGIVTNKISSPLNTSADELSPTLDIRGDKLLFTRVDGGIPLLYEAQKDSLGQWVASKVEIDSASNLLNKYITALSPDGITALSVIDQDAESFHLSTLELKDSIWIEQEQIIIPNIQLLKQKSDFFLSNSRKIMLMSLTDNRTEYTSNLYVSFKEKDGHWTTPKSLGKKINTLGKETSPFLSVDGKTLYFASTGHQSFGGSDLFAARRLDDTWLNWSTPENLGSTVNTKEDETDLCIPISGDIGYFSRRNAEGNMDIYSIKLPILLPPEPIALVSGIALNKTSQQPIHARIIYTDLETQEEIGTVFSNATTGKYFITLPLGKKYSYLAQATGYLSQSENIDLSTQKKDVKAQQNLFLLPIEETSTLTLKNIFYATNSSYLEKSSYDELDRVVALLKNEPSILEVEIAGFTDSQGKESYNQWLSEKRAKSVKEYLIKKGIEEHKLVAVGRGETFPIAPNETVDGRKLNRRVEFKILKLEQINK